ncbi:MAG: hypothetical protein WC794_01015 [Candidatus Doudnabacteria bacterium]|jgi:hypothetical protein
MTTPSMPKQRNFIKFFLIALGFVLFYIYYFTTDKEVFRAEFLTAAAKVPSIRNYAVSARTEMPKFFSTYGVYIGIGLGILSWLMSLLLLGLLKLVRLAKYGFAKILVLVLVYGAYLALAIELLYYEKRYSALALGIIFYVGGPLYSAALATLILVGSIFLLQIVKKIFKNKQTPPTSTPTTGDKVLEPILNAEKVEKPKETPTTGTVVKVLALSTIMLVSSGCSLISDSEDAACIFAPDPAHCYQEAAVSGGGADTCDKIKQPEKFKSMGSNPPQDKCYLMVAQNTGDLDACNKIKGGPLSYTKEQCVLEASVETQNAEGCQRLSGADKTKCAQALGPLMTADKALEVDNQIEIIKDQLKKGSDTDLEKQLTGLQTKLDAMLGIMSKDNKAQFEIQKDPINKEILGEWATGGFDSETKNKLIGLNEKLKSQGSSMTKEQFTAVRDYYKFINDPANDIEKMDDAQIIKDRFGEKVGGLVDKMKFWNSNDTAQEKALDQQLRFYERMLERQAAINKGLSEKQMNFENTAEAIGEKVKEKVLDKAKEKIIEELFGSVTEKTAGITSAVVGEAIDTVKKEAKSAEFRGLVKAYNDGMNEELSKFGGNVEKAHAEVVKKINADPYTYASGNSFAKYGNLVENKNCDGTNPHCIEKDVFWKAMKKSYNYQHQTQ